MLFGQLLHTQGEGLALPAEVQPGDALQCTALLKHAVTTEFLGENFFLNPFRGPSAPARFGKGPHGCFLLSQQDREKFGTDNCESPD